MQQTPCNVSQRSFVEIEHFNFLGEVCENEVSFNEKIVRCCLKKYLNCFWWQTNYLTHQEKYVNYFSLFVFLKFET